MKKIVLSGCLVFLSVLSFAQGLQLKKEVVFREGEVLSYTFKYGFISVAEATIKILASDLLFDTKPTYRLSVDTRTLGMFDVFYKIRDRYDSYIDKTTLTPYFYQENIREGRYQRQDKARFYQDSKKIQHSHGTLTTPTSQTFDLVSSYYFARNLDLSKARPGDKFELNYFLGNEVSVLGFEYIGKETIKTKMGSMKCLKFSPVISPGKVLKKDTKLFLWVTDDENRIPVRAEGNIALGSLTLEIESANGLKYPLVVHNN